MCNEELTEDDIRNFEACNGYGHFHNCRKVYCI